MGHDRYGDPMVAPVTYPSSNVRVVDDEIPGRPRPEDLVRLSAPLSHELTAELDGAVEAARVGIEEMLLAALGSFKKFSFQRVRIITASLKRNNYGNQDEKSFFHVGIIAWWWVYGKGDVGD